MAELGNIKGQTFLVTGGASGLGAKYAERFLKDGAKAVAILDIAEVVGKATSERLNKEYPGKVIFLKCDVGNEDSINEAFSAVIEKFGRLDTIVNNAGLMNDSPKVWAKMCDVNWRGLVSFTSKGIEHMRKDKGGSGGTIVNISSIAGLLRFKFLPVYCGTKLAVLHFTQSIATPDFFEKTGVRLMTIGFGPTDTPLMQNLDKLTFVNTEGQDFVTDTQQSPFSVFQTVEGAVEGFIKMYRDGGPGTIWMSVGDTPVRDITAKIENAYAIMQDAVFN